MLNCQYARKQRQQFTWQDFQNRVNSELAANVGNFINRVAVLLHKFYDGEIPLVTLDAQNQDILQTCAVLSNNINTYLDKFKFKDAPYNSNVDILNRE